MSPRGFCFTVMNWTEQDLCQLLELFDSATYSIVGFEHAPTTGTPHLQAYGYWKNKKSFNVVQKKVPRATIFVAKGTPLQNKIYCSKEGEFEEFGECPRQGERTDLQNFADDIQAGISEEDLIEIHTENMAKYDRFYQRCKNIQLKKISQQCIDPEVIIIYGEPGSGKTRHVYDTEDINNIYKMECGDGSANSIFWDGYTGEEVILIDDFHNNFKLDYMLRLLDRYPMKLNIKGGYTYRCAKRIYITSNICPMDWYPNCPPIHRQALFRRINKLINLRTNEIIPIEEMLTHLQV